MTNQINIKNCILFNDPEKQLTNIIIRDNKIFDIGIINTASNIPEIDAEGRLVSPGFIDLHIQGAGGSDVLDGTTEALTIMSKTLARYGVTGFLATTLMDQKQNNAHLTLTSDLVNKNIGGAKILGIHLEGPFINPLKKGGLASESIYSATISAYNDIIGLTGDSLKMMTIAPELDNVLPVIKKMKNNNCIASFGHSNASYGDTIKGIQAGMNHVTHICNAMPGLNHRNPGPLLAIFESNNITAQIISDGVHLHPRMVNYLYKTLGSERCICITDGIQALGLPDGEYQYNGRKYISKKGTARYEDGTLIGCALDLCEIAMRFKKFTNCSMEEAIDTITINPAKVLGIENQKGSIGKSKDADLVILNSDNSVYSTIVQGDVVYEQN